MKSRNCLPLVLAALMALSGAGCERIERSDPHYIVPTEPAPTEAPTEEETQPPEPERVRFLAVGDNLIHSCIYRTAAEHAGDGQSYDFSYCYENVANLVGGADLAFINQETVIAEGFEVSGSNLNFNSPPELGETLVETGFDIINLANNHILDKGMEGLSADLDYWDSQVEAHPGLIVEGVYRDSQDMESYRIAEVGDMRIGVLGYTEHTNGYKLYGDTELEIPYTSDRALMERQIRALDEQADCVIVSMHWGVEDTHVVTDEVRSLAQDLVEWGADVVVGTGPHTLQTMEYLTRSDGTQGFVFYSLGNFISGQTDNFNMVGGMGQLDIVRDSDGNVTIEDVQLLPLITHYETGSLNNVRVYPYYMYTDDLVAAHGIPYSPMGTAKSWSWDVINGIIENNVPEQFRQLEEK
ncbi:MAG: CapA family protein [Oscillospiraceae bacterium]|nr:CapA family protein [Oscillospiraceae bacterium]